MPQLLADLQDINKHMPGHKVEADDANTSPWQIEANRIVKATLSGFFSPTTLHSWSGPADTPGIIRSIAGKLIAAYLYRALYSEDETAVPEYAQTLYNEAILELTQIRDGVVVVLDDNDEPVPVAEGAGSLQFGPLDFYPNDDAPGPYFRMADTWA